jgi:hypothetical protein
VEAVDGPSIPPKKRAAVVISGESINLIKQEKNRSPYWCPSRGICTERSSIPASSLDLTSASTKQEPSSARELELDDE